MRKPLLLLSLLFTVVACGPDGTTHVEYIEPEPVPQIKGLIEEPGDASIEEIEAYAIELTNKRYIGNDDVAEVNPSSSQALYTNVLGQTPYVAPVPKLHDLNSEKGEDGQVDVVKSCAASGSVRYTGKLDDNGSGILKVQYSGCQSSREMRSATGLAVVHINEFDDNLIKADFYYDNLTWRGGPFIEGHFITISGYQKYHYESNEQPEFSVYERIEYRLFIDAELHEKTLLLDAYSVYQQGNESSTFEHQGVYFDENFGQLRFSYLSPEQVSESYDAFYQYGYQITGNGNAQIFIGNDRVLYEQDLDANAVYEVGAMFSSEMDFESRDVSQLELHPTSVLSVPPTVGLPKIIDSSYLYATSEIIATITDYSDIDTPEDKLTFSFNWYLNGELLEGLHGNTLPPFTAVHGDDLRVSGVVSDGITAVEGDRLLLYISNSPEQLLIKNLPTTIAAGEVLRFSATFEDPDLRGEVSEPAFFVSGPKGVVLSDDGIVEWTADTQLLLDAQIYQFTFSEDESSDEYVTASITVTSEKSLPMTRSAIAPPAKNKSMWSADFSGDGNNEILTTDSNYQIQLIKEYDNRYVQSWVYPYTLPSGGKIIQVRPIQFDQDNEMEILVATERGFSVITDLKSPAKLLFKKYNLIKAFAVDDLNKDGTLELVYLHTKYSSTSDDAILSVVSLDEATKTLYSTDAPNAVDLSIGDTDDDPQLEIVLNTGIVFDGQTLEVQWDNGADFGGNMVVLGDIDGNGKDEIVGVTRYRDLTIFSVDEKSQLLKVEKTNICTLTAANVDDDIEHEILLGDCSDGNISAYDFTKSSLINKWEVGGNIEKTLSLNVGDTDNDGNPEIFWGGCSSSGAGSSSSGNYAILVADITSNGAEVNDASILPQLKNFSTAGWASNINDDDKAVFFAQDSSELNTTTHSRILTMTRDGEYEISNELYWVAGNDNLASVGDFDGNGVDDILVPSYIGHDNSYSVLQLDDYTEIGSSTGNFDTYANSTVVKAFDTNNDGKEYGLIAKNSALSVIDFEAERLLSQFDYTVTIRDFAIYQQPQSRMILSSSYRISIMSLDSSGLSELDFVKSGCSNVEMINIDEDLELEVACLAWQNGFDSDVIIIYDTDGDKLLEKQRFEYDFTILDMSADPSTQYNQGLLLSVLNEDKYNIGTDRDEYRLSRLYNDGLLNWSSAPLIGQPKTHGLKSRIKDGELEVLLSTSTVMYWF